MRALLLNINADPGNDARVATAIALANAMAAHVICIQVLPPPFVVGDVAATVTVPEAMDVIERAAQDVQDKIEIRLGQAGLERTWLRPYGDVAATIVSHARLADLILLSAEDSVPPVSSIALNARPPVLTTPRQGAAFTVETSALIAWNGSFAAADALRAAVPLLREMESIRIVSVDGDNDEFPAASAADYLSHYALQADVHWRRSEGETVAETILAIAGEFGSGLIVAGAFGHNIVREMLLGSVTRELLRRSPLPLFLAH
ncbi:MAG: universal stress protein [Alphaproteobacteria bacterium]|nr:universal stress protein [Alphaproteobacteria bacterium]